MPILKSFPNVISGGDVASVFGRTGAVVAAAGDYTAALITNTPAGGIASTTVQAALNELDTEKLGASAAALAYQPLNAALTAIALLTTTSFGRGLLTTADAAALRAAASLDTWAGSANMTTIGTVSSGTWQAGIVQPLYGGTGHNSIADLSREMMVPTPSGSWLATTAYARGDLVTHGDWSWRCLEPHNGGNDDDEPGVGGNYATYWQHFLPSAPALDATLTALAALADGAGVLTNDGAGALSYTATSTGGNGAVDAGKLAEFNSFGGLTVKHHVSGGFWVSGTTKSGQLRENGVFCHYGAFTASIAFPSTFASNFSLLVPEASGTILLTDGSGASLTSLNASALASGTVPTARLGTGTADSTTYLRGDNTWQTIASGDTPGGSGTELQYRAGASTLGAITGSSVSGANLTLAGVLGMPGGSAAAPAIAASGDTDTGIYWSAADTLAFATGGAVRATLGLSGGVGSMTLHTPSGSAAYSASGGGAQLGTASVNASLTPYWTVTAASGNFASSNRAYTFSLGGDVTLVGDAADVLAHRRGTNAQTVRIYGTYTNSTNYVRLGLNTTSTTLEIAAETAGTGADDIDLLLTPAGTGRVKFGTYYAIGAETVTGYVEIKDTGGTTRKLAVLS